MTPAELARECVAAIKRRDEAVKAERRPEGAEPFLRLTLPGPCNGRRRRVVFADPRLMGEVLCESVDVDGKPITVVLVDPFEVLAWLASTGLVEVKVEQKRRKR